MVKKSLMVGIFILCTTSLAYADWLDDLAKNIGPKQQWNEKEALRIIEKYLEEDEKHIKDVESRIENTKNSGLWATFHQGAYQVELATSKSQKNYHEKVKKILKELRENKKEKERFVQSLAALYRNIGELEVLKQNLNNAKDTSEKIKLGAQIVAKQTEIAGRKTFIKSSFLFS